MDEWICYEHRKTRKLWEKMKKKEAPPFYGLNLADSHISGFRMYDGTFSSEIKKKTKWKIKDVLDFSGSRKCHIIMELLL